MFKNRDIKKLIIKIVISIICYPVGLYFGWVIHMCLKYLGISDVIAFPGLFLVLLFAYPCIWISQREKVIRYYSSFIVIYILFVILDFCFFVPATHPVKASIYSMFM